MKQYNFNEQLNKSENPKEEKFWQSVYKSQFPDLENMITCKGPTQAQKLGFDRILQLKSGKILFIDQKSDYTDYQNFFLETISVEEDNAPGWMVKDLLIDYVAYAFIKRNECYFLPYYSLMRVWHFYENIWTSTYGIKKVPNESCKNYNTLGIAVPINVVLQKIKDSFRVAYKSPMT
jgi:hypothetical protein